MSKAARFAWPGNIIPVFRGNKDKLDNLVEQLKPTCASKFYKEHAIRQHILDSLKGGRLRGGTTTLK